MAGNRFLPLEGLDHAETGVGGLRLFEVLGIHNPVGSVLVKDNFHPNFIEVIRVEPGDQQADEILTFQNR